MSGPEKKPSKQKRKSLSQPPSRLQPQPPSQDIPWRRWWLIFGVGLIIIGSIVYIKSWLANSQSAITISMTVSFIAFGLICSLIQALLVAFPSHGTQKKPPRKVRPFIIRGITSVLIIVLLSGAIIATAVPYGTPHISNMPSPTPSTLPPIGDEAKAMDLYHKIVQGRRPDWQDNFDDAAYSRKSNGWTFYSQQQLGCELVGGSLLARSSKQGAIAACYATGMRWSNFAYQVRIARQDGDSGGILFRALNTNPASATYRLNIVPKRQIFNLLIQSDTSRLNPICNRAKLKECFNPIIDTQGKNSLTVIAQNHDLYFYVNDVFLAQITDATSLSGMIGVFSFDSDNPSSTLFESTRVWAL